MATGPDPHLGRHRALAVVGAQLLAAVVGLVVLWLLRWVLLLAFGAILLAVLIDGGFTL